ncbi:hypothetical protein ACP70R_006735 [Stipagrostis hirtigluma subsp. patula]
MASRKSGLSNKQTAKKTKTKKGSTAKAGKPKVTVLKKAVPTNGRKKIAKARPGKKHGRAGLVHATAPKIEARDCRDGKQSIKLRQSTVHKPDDLSTGRLGEAAVHHYFVERLGSHNVHWVNEQSESGLPYDIIITKGDGLEYVEVKATGNAEKNWLYITPREWQFASEKGDSFSIANVLLLGDSRASINLLKNPHKLCRQQKDLNLAILMLKKHRELVGGSVNQITITLKPDPK